MKYYFYDQIAQAFVSINIWDSFPFSPFPTHLQCCPTALLSSLSPSLSHHSACCWTEQQSLCAFPLQLASSNEVSPYWYKGNIYLGEKFVQVTIHNSGNAVPLKCGGKSSLFLLGLQPKKMRVRKKGGWIKTMKDTFPVSYKNTSKLRTKCWAVFLPTK